MINAELILKHPDIKAEIHKRGMEIIEKCAIFMAAKVIDELGVAYPPASRPGEPPRKRSGELQRDVTYEVNERAGTASVGVTSAYGPFLERGTRYMSARPFLFATFRKYMGELKAVVREL
jgi:HK97 gp10 family phage protein